MTSLSLLLALSGTITLQSVVKGQWDIRSEIPLISGSPVQNLAGKTVGHFMRAEYQEFLKNAKQDRKELPELPGFSFEAAADRKVSNARVVSLVVGTYRYSGGAHGVAMSTCFNFGLVGKRPKQLAWNDVFLPHHRRDLELVLLGRALKKDHADWIQSGDKNSFSDAELSRFWVKPGVGLVWEFDSYDLGSYASGPFTFEIPWSDVRAYMRPQNPLASAMTR